ncbi:hypothetical protein C8Q77DRAFT_1120311 [Trametes polyzona]|nr:hypothetical protein C8Q77DRAFT_1120311 [Trametes polyzona]
MPANRANKASPQSVGSDDTGIMAAVAAQMQSSWEKKRKEKESKFLQSAKAELKECIAGRTEAYNAAIADLNGAYERFVIEYAQVDDEIRKLWTRLQQEQQKILSLSEQKHRGMLERDRERENGQVKGMAITKKAVEDFGRLIGSLEEI